ncbi:hypothetical protein P7J26_04315 [Streptococcus suis]|uniref:Conjugal transfer protein n=3 Tax=Streptococcus suis TaxID=1307 RepID=A0A4T2HB95_STRSU|nr:hypothetical protein [Streptococcus suis]TII07881.1 hypothetical protein FAJ34_05865 [Streptococcus suis]
MFEFKDGLFTIRATGQEIKLSDLGSKLLLDVEWLNPLTGFDYIINMFFNGIIWFNHFLFELFVKAYNLLGKSGGSVDKVIIEVIDRNASLFNTIFDAVKWYALIIIFCYAAYIQLTRRGSGLKILMFTLLGMAFLQQAYAVPKEYNPQAYSLSGGVQVLKEEKAQPRTYVSKIYNGVSTSLDKIQNEVTKGLLAEQNNKVLEIYFEEAVWKPYRGMNADKKKEGGYNLTDEQLIALFGYRDDNKDYKILGKNIEEVVGTKDEPIVENIRTLGNKFSYILVMTVEVPLLGIILNGLALFSFFLKIGILLLVELLPFILVLAILPFFWRMLWNVTRTIGYALVLSSMLGMGATVLVLFNSILSDILQKLTGEDIVFALALRLVIYYLLWRFRSQLGRVFRGRSLAPAGRMLRNAGVNAKQTIQKGLGMVVKPALAGGLMTLGAGKIGANKLLSAYRRTADNRSVKRHMKQGDSLEVAKMKTEQGKEISVLRRKEPMKKLRGASNGLQALTYRLMANGYLKNSAGRQHYEGRQHSVLMRTQRDKIDTLDRKQRIKRLGGAIRHQQRIDEFKKRWKQPSQPLLEPSGPMFIDFRSKTESPKQIFKTVTDKTISPLRKERNEVIIT